MAEAAGKNRAFARGRAGPGRSPDPAPSNDMAEAAGKNRAFARGRAGPGRSPDPAPSNDMAEAAGKNRAFARGRAGPGRSPDPAPPPQVAEAAGKNRAFARGRAGPGRSPDPAHVLEVSAEGPAQLFHALEALGLVDRHALGDELREAGRQGGIDLLRRARLALHVLIHDRHVIAAGVGG